MNYQLKNIATGALQSTSVMPTWQAGIWECGNLRVTDVTGTAYIAVSIPPPPILTPVRFKLLWTSPERVGIKTLRTTDAAVEDFMSLVDDVRLTEVDLSLTSTQNAIQYVLAKLPTSIVPVGQAAVRYAQIMAGTFQ
jgi:hypothetical protein